MQTLNVPQKHIDEEDIECVLISLGVSMRVEVYMKIFSLARAYTSSSIVRAYN